MTEPQTARKPLNWETDSRFLKPVDFMVGGKFIEVTLTIKFVSKKDEFVAQDKSKVKGIVVGFEQTDKLFCCAAKCNMVRAAEACGGRDANPVGKKLTIYVAHGRWFNEEQLALRVRGPKGRPGQKIDSKHTGIDMTGKPC